MALLWMEGFEDMTTAATATEVNTNLQERMSNVDLPASGNPIVATRTGFVGLQLPSGDDFTTPYLRKSHDGSSATNQTLIFGFYLETGNNFSSLNDWIWVRTSSVVLCGFEWNADGTVDFQRGTSTVLGTSTFAFAANTKYYIEFKIVLDSSAGTMEMKVADLTSDDDAETTSEWSLTGLNNINTSAHSTFEQSWTRVQFFSNPNGGNFTWDDIYVCDGSGTENIDFLGNIAVEGLRPNGAGSSTGWTPSAGSNYQNVDDTDEDGHDGDTTYNTADADAESDLYAFENLAMAGEVIGVQLHADVKVTQGDPRQIRFQAREGSTTGESGDVTILHNDYQQRFHVFETNPDSSMLWADTEVNGAEFGLKRQS